MVEIWNQCLESLKHSISLQHFSIWVKPLKARQTNGRLMISAPNQATLDFVNKHLRKQIIRSVKQHDQNVKIEIGISKTKSPKPEKHRYEAALFDEYRFENLVLGDANQVACAAAQQIAQDLKSSPYNPFVIYGSSGLGKTHLMQATGHLARAHNPLIKIIYLPLMDFVRNLTASLRHNTVEEMKLYYQSADLLLIDDIHLIAGKEKSQEEFFHIFNFLFSLKKQIILTCDQIPQKIPDLETRLRSRLHQGLNLKLAPPELEMRAAILLRKSQNPQINLALNEDMALFIAGHITSNVRELEGALLKIKAFVDFKKIRDFEIGKEVIETALDDLIKPKNGVFDISDIQKVVGKYYGVSLSDLVSKSRRSNLVEARQMAIMLCQEMTNLSLKKIGKNFGNRDHTTVLYACKKLRGLIEKNKDIHNDYQNLKLKLSNI